MAYLTAGLRRPFVAMARELLWSLRPRTTVDYGAFTLEIDRRDNGGRLYLEPQYWAPMRCRFEQSLARWLAPDVYLDIGANYGYTALTHHAVNPEARIICVEPQQRVIPFLRRNLQRNGVQQATVIEGLCSDAPNPAAEFALNPRSTQNSGGRLQQGWKRVSVTGTTVDEILMADAPTGAVYIKIDTQGHEPEVLAGAQRFLASAPRWAIRMEFWPKALRSGDHDPVALLRDLSADFLVSEVPDRARYRGDDLRSVVSQHLREQDFAPFVDHVADRANGAGWCDLLILPQRAWDALA